MLPRLSGPIGVIAALAATAVACKKDPTADGAGTPAAIQAALAALNVNIGSSGTVTGTTSSCCTSSMSSPAKRWRSSATVGSTQTTLSRCWTVLSPNAGTLRGSSAVTTDRS